MKASRTHVPSPEDRIASAGAASGDGRQNDLHLVREVLGVLREAGLHVWLFGGWAEELRGMRAPSAHTDIDILLRGAAFELLDAFLAERSEAVEIREKRFSHKRAFVWHDVRVEIVLVRPGSPGTSDIFDGRVVIEWPPDTFAEPSVAGMPACSRGALALYRDRHDLVVTAYAAHRALGPHRTGPPTRDG